MSRDRSSCLAREVRPMLNRARRVGADKMGNIVEYIGNDGVVSTPATRDRLERPRSGDVVQWADGQYGRIWESGSGFCKPGEVQVCSGMGSAFLSRSGVDISGGPFFVLPISDLQPLLKLHMTDVWNWGDNVRGADKGVHYGIARPVFAYVGTADIYTHRVAVEVTA